MKETHHIFCAILLLFCLFGVEHVQSIYDPNAFVSHQTNENGNNFIDDDTPKTECPPNFTGQIPYAMDCRQYLNCWRGRGTVQSCSPGTMFNPRTMECDHPSKVKCKHFDGFSSSNRNQRQQFQRQELATIQCESGVSGLFAHPLDCTKFLNCDHGHTFIQDCGPGTAFNDLFKVCDWPHKVDCGTRPLNGIVNENENTNPNPNGNTNQNSNGNSNPNGNSNQNANGHSNPNRYPYSDPYTNGNPNRNPNSNPSWTTEKPYYGEGNFDIRMDASTDSRAHAQPQFPQQNIQNHQLQHQYPPYQQHDIYNQQQLPTRSQSKDGINSLSHSFSSPKNTDESFIKGETPNPVEAIPNEPIPVDHIPAESQSLPNTEYIKVPVQELLPPFEDELSSSTNNRAGRLDKTGQIGGIESIYGVDHRPTESSWSSFGTVKPRPNITLPPHAQFPESDNQQTVRGFNRHFANPKPNVPLPPTTTEKPSETATKVYQIYPMGFETIGSKCERMGEGLHEHPYDCSRYMICENGKLRVRNCNSGYMFNPTLKICDFNFKCNAEDSDQGQKPQTQDNSPGNFEIVREISQRTVPDNRFNEIYDGDKKKKPEVTTPVSTGFDSSQTTPSIPTAYFIPDMSILPLETGRYPHNSYGIQEKPQNLSPVRNNLPTQQQKPPTYFGFGKPSQGGDIQPDSFDSHTESLTNRAGKDLIHNEIVEVTTQKKLPLGKEHVMPIYQRTTKTSIISTTPTIDITKYHTPQPYNHMYYQPFAKPLTEPEQKDETDYIPISDALKILLRPYMKTNETTEPTQVTQIEDKLINMIDDGKTNKKPIEQDSLASALLNEDISVKNLPESPQSVLRSDTESIQTTTEQQQFTPTTKSSHFHEPLHSTPDFKHSPAFHAQNPHLNQPQYYKPGTNDPVKITFPGAHSQTHPIHGQYHHPPPFHGAQAPLTQMHSTHHNHYEHGHHPHFGPNYHSNAANYDLAYNQRHIESTTPITASAPSPNAYPRDQEKPTTTSRFGKTQYAEISTCDGQFDCGTGFCIPFSQICDGKNDCGNRYDELNCPHVNYQVRLSNDKGHRHMGRIEVRAFGKWGYVCDDKFTLNNANVLCRELGFNMGAAEVKSNSFFSPNANMPAADNNMFQMDDVNCQGNETSLKDCDFNGWGVSDCNAEEVVGVVCKVTVMQCPPNHWLCQESEECIPMSFMCDGLKDCTDGSDENAMHCSAKIEYRLMDGTDLEGRVEVKYRGVWGTVCDDDFGDKEATVFCKTLGFTGPATVLNKRHGMSTGPIWLDQVDCLGNETTLDKCMHFEWSESNCNHTEDVSVKCSYGLDTKSSRYISNDNSLQRLTNNRETHGYLREVQRNSKSIPDFSNVCGRVRVTGEDDSEEDLDRFRVISGTRTKRGFHPWQATIRARGRNGRSSHWCGAVIISKNHILTAAHCLIGFPKGAYFVRLGDHHSEIIEESEVEIFIENWFIHDEFRKEQMMNNDIALIQLKTPIQFTNYIQPICLPDKETRYEPGKNCTISGWGSIQYGKSTPSLDLKAAHVPLIAQDVCRQRDIYGDEIMDTMFCAGYLDRSGVDACDGDSGGPLVCPDESGVHSLYGIISWGQRCGDSTKPGVYVKVKQYLDWIKEKMNLLN